METIALIGFMGAGKTTVGAKLAEMQKIPMVDTDQLIEEKAGMKISRIFAELGEEAFRKMETEMLCELAQRKDPCIISCGGGLPLREENRLLLKKAAKVVWLQVSPETVEERLKGDNTRPLLAGPDAGEKIWSLIAARKEPYTLAADHIIAVDGLNPEIIAENIISFSK